MPTLTAIEPCEPPVLMRDQTAGPSIDMDHRILAALCTSGTHVMQLQDITRVVGGTTHHVHARVQTLIDRGFVARVRLPNGPRRGPGASRYVLLQVES